MILIKSEIESLNRLAVRESDEATIHIIQCPSHSVEEDCEQLKMILIKSEIESLNKIAAKESDEATFQIVQCPSIGVEEDGYVKYYKHLVRVVQHGFKPKLLSIGDEL